MFDQLSCDDDPFDTEDDDDEGEDIIEYQGVSYKCLFTILLIAFTCAS